MSDRMIPLWWRDWIRPLIIIDRARVDPRQLAKVGTNGGIVLCDGDPHTAVMVIDPLGGDYQYVAGLISEDL